MIQRDRHRGCLLGLAVGDAIGTTVEFLPRGTFAPVTDMTGGGPFQLKAGEWTDDTSMALCLGASFLHSGGFDARDQINRYCNWRQHGYMSCNGKCFDIGGTVSRALLDYERTREPLSGSDDPRAAGNGSIMRLAPVPMFYSGDQKEAVERSGDSSRTTHGAAECIDACKYFGLVLWRTLYGNDKDAVLADCDAAVVSCESIRAIARGMYKSKSVEEVRGSGYVVESLEAALWSFWSSESFEEAVLKAVNLGDDADTTGAVCGQVAGAFYGEKGIPSRWLEQLAMVDDIRKMADELFSASSAG